MQRTLLYEQLIRAVHPKEVFGEADDEAALKQQYYRLSKLIHPDSATSAEKYISNEGFARLNELYSIGLEMMRNGTYATSSFSAAYFGKAPLFSLELHSRVYDICEQLCQGEVADIFRGVSNGRIFCMKYAREASDNALLKAEFETLCALAHAQLPIVRDFAEIDGLSAVFMDDIPGETLSALHERYSSGVPQKHAMWMMERLLNVVGYLHANKIIHGNLVPDNIIVNGKNHKVSLVGFSFHIPRANEAGAYYRIKGETFFAPEIGKSTPVSPAADVYSVGMLMLWLLGGDVRQRTLPAGVSPSITGFLRRMTDYPNRPMDAWELWDQWRALRQRLYPDHTFEEFN